MIPLSFRWLHDIGRSGWWYGFHIIKKVGFFVSIAFDVIMSLAYSDNLQGYESPMALAIVAKYGIWLVAIFAYQVLLIVFYCIDSEAEEKEYGESPKYQIVQKEGGEVEPT